MNREPDVTIRERETGDPEPRVVAPPRRSVVEPLAPACYQVRFTAGGELREKLERLQALMRSAVPEGDLARIIDIAVTEKLQRVEAKRHIPAAVKRRVYAREGGRSAYRDEHGRRCARRHDLEFHHRHPFARGGDHSPSNLTLMCKVHNTLVAEQAYGVDVMSRFRAATSRAPVPVHAHGTPIVARQRWSCGG